MTVTISDAVAGVQYTVFTTDSLSKDFTAYADSTTIAAGTHAFEIDIDNDADVMFVKIVATLESVKAGTSLTALEAE